MSEKVLCEKSDLVAIADAVREATGSTENYNVSELSAATVEAISAGGSSGSVETCTVTGVELEGTVTYSDGKQIVTDAESLYYGTPISVAKPSLLWFDCNSGVAATFEINGNAEIVYQSLRYHVFAVNGDCTITNQ